MFAWLLAAAAAALASLTGDFDGDGRADAVRVAPDSGGYVLLVQLAAAEAPQAVMAFNDPQSFVVRLQPPGTYKTFCAKSRDCRPGERKRVKVKGDVLAFGTAGGATAVAVWTGKAFEVEWLAD